MALNSIEELVEDIRQGKMVILMDDEDRENEGDLIMAAECCKAEHINFMAKHARGLICMPMSRERCELLKLPLMAPRNGSGFGTKFTVSIEAAEGVTTGISAADRARTVQAAAAKDAKAEDIVSPGHIFPLMAQAGGTLARAGHTEAACDLARMAEQEMVAVQMASMDELTLLSNRRGFRTLAQHALDVCERLSRPATLLYFDLNDFKPINDRFGHAEGDRALKTFADVLRIAFRESDVIGRLGGDEFVALLTGSSHVEISAIMARLREVLDERNAMLQRGYDIRFSVGQVEYGPQHHESIDSLLADADAAMYAHKQGKRC
ncbi:3,4-dihydroxy-2-butanone-4-phosphate synthase [Pseudomonas corrugata]|uniref:3,4-dihydroxy-2-butanone-4-phosphate synthase n=1 Tax=Pseudomonas corrugata TaxID=47879 RepID=UPI0006D896F2|nr:3,4-dihydroxy-2-butanone-4-phosphate synthase [Pseudomonas corrugata]